MRPRALARSSAESAAPNTPSASCDDSGNEATPIDMLTCSARHAGVDLAHRRADALGHVARLDQPGARQDHDELLAAVAGEVVGLA